MTTLQEMKFLEGCLMVYKEGTKERKDTLTKLAFLYKIRNKFIYKTKNNNVTCKSIRSACCN